MQSGSAVCVFLGLAGALYGQSAPERLTPAQTLAVVPMSGLREISEEFFHIYTPGKDLPMMVVSEAAEKSSLKPLDPTAAWASPHSYVAKVRGLNFAAYKPKNEEIELPDGMKFEADMYAMAALPATELVSFENAPQPAPYQTAFKLNAKPMEVLTAAYTTRKAGALVQHPVAASRVSRTIAGSLVDYPWLRTVLRFDIAKVAFGVPLAYHLTPQAGGIEAEAPGRDLYLVCLAIDLETGFDSSAIERLSFGAEIAGSDSLARGLFPFDGQNDGGPPDATPRKCGPGWSVYAPAPRVLLVGVQTASPGWRLEKEAMTGASHRFALIVSVPAGTKALALTMATCADPKPVFGMRPSGQSCTEPVAANLALNP